jgi:hypothetical protein
LPLTGGARHPHVGHVPARERALAIDAQLDRRRAHLAFEHAEDEHLALEARRGDHAALGLPDEPAGRGQLGRQRRAACAAEEQVLGAGSEHIRARVRRQTLEELRAREACAARIIGAPHTA